VRVMRRTSTLLVRLNQTCVRVPPRRGPRPTVHASNFYAGGAGGPSKDYGITFGTSAKGAVDADVAIGGYNFAYEPSPDTVLLLQGDESQAFLTVPGGFTGLSLQYACSNAFTATLYDGPDLSGNALGTTSFPATSTCGGGCGDPEGAYGIWFNVTVAFLQVAQSAGFSTSRFIFIDDMVVRLASETNSPTSAPTSPPTKAPTKHPTKAPTKHPTKAPTNSPTKVPTTWPPTKSPTTPACRRKGVKGAGMRCMKRMKLMKPKVV
jgi:hypothetical protein